MTSVTTDGRSRRAQEKRKTRRAEILSAAERVIAKRGYQATSIADVLEAAQISRGTFYLYFDSRESLFHELISGFIQQLMGCIKVVHREEGDPVGGLYANVSRVVDLLFDNPNLTTILLREAVGQDAVVDQKLNDLYAFLYKMVSGALKNGSAWGITRKVDERVVAMAIIGSIKEVLYQYLVIHTNQTPDRETIAQELLAFGLKGLQTS